MENSTSKNESLQRFSEIFRNALDEKIKGQFAKSIVKNVHAQFEDVDLSAPYVKKIIKREAKERGKTVKEITEDLQQRLDIQMSHMEHANERQNAVNKKNMIESILFDYITPSDKVPKVTLKELKEMIKWVRVSNPAFFKLRDPITGKKVKVSIHVTPAPKFIKQPEWMKQVGTAAATANGELIFNVAFCKQLIQYAHMKGVKPAGGMYESNGGNIPDAYAYIEFLILHEIYHIVHADHFYGSVDLANLMMRDGPARWPKLLQSAGWSGDISTKRGRKTLRRAARRANGKIQNYIGDYITNYELKKKGYAQLPIGLFASEYNYDYFDSMEDIQIAVLDDIEEGTPDPQNSLMDKISEMQSAMDEHLDADNNQVNGDDDSDGSDGSGGSDLGDMPDEDEIAEMSPEELADMLDKMKGGEDNDMDLTDEELQDIQDIQDAIEDRIEDIMEDDEVSDEEKQAIQDALENQEDGQWEHLSGDGEETENDDEFDDEADPLDDEGDGSDEADPDNAIEGGSGASSSAPVNPEDPLDDSDEEEKDEDEKTDQEKIDDAMKETAKDEDMLDADERDELTSEKVEEEIKKMEEEAEAEEEERMKAVEDAKEVRKKARNGGSGEGLKKPVKPINWKILLKKMVPKPIDIEEESITKMHNRTKSSLAMALDSDDNDGIAIKAGIIKDEKNIQKLLFVLDNSGSMATTIAGVNPDIMKVIEKSKLNGIEDMYIIKFDSDWDVYKIDLDKTGKKHKFRQFKNNMDIVKKAEYLNDPKKVDKLLEKNSYPIKVLFRDMWGGGTEFPVEMSKIILKMISGKDGAFNGVMFTDTDILGDGNMAVLKKIALVASKRPFSFNIILNNRASFDAVKPKLSGYKYISYIGKKEI